MVSARRGSGVWLNRARNHNAALQTAGECSLGPVPRQQLLERPKDSPSVITWAAPSQDWQSWRRRSKEELHLKKTVMATNAVIARTGTQCHRSLC